jgi:hypothetical protein
MNEGRTPVERRTTTDARCICDEHKSAQSTTDDTAPLEGCQCPSLRPSGDESDEVEWPKEVVGATHPPPSDPARKASTKSSACSFQASLASEVDTESKALASHRAESKPLRERRRVVSSPPVSSRPQKARVFAMGGIA